MKQFHFSSNLSTLMELYLTTRNEEGYLSDHYGYYLQELDCLSKAMQNESFVTRELVEAWDAAKPSTSSRFSHLLLCPAGGKRGAIIAHWLSVKSLA